ncbi:hypothetical protein OnM2_052039 [Erysiphe neolycopersici]|uniref:Uncharacterized protein n=1 Tax=Erysiphe neolycopersici TaxID=212602 RepID=A0A420HSB1_9PEZI|nr:hypothetical protein OnM2_052039 [Erysiphe neolycopersici]
MFTSILNNSFLSMVYLPASYIISKHQALGRESLEKVARILTMRIFMFTRTAILTTETSLRIAD